MAVNNTATTVKSFKCYHYALYIAFQRIGLHTYRSVAYSMIVLHSCIYIHMQIQNIHGKNGFALC